MKLVLKNKVLIPDNNFIVVEFENKSETLDIEILDSKLLDKWAFLEFRNNNCLAYTTSQLPIVDNIIHYELPNVLLRRGTLQIQVIFRYENNWVWKSRIKEITINNSINATKDLDDEYPDFIASTVERLSILEEKTSEEETIIGEHSTRLSLLEEDKLDKRLNTLPSITDDNTNNISYLYVDVNGVSKKITIKELGERLISVNQQSSQIKQVGQISFLDTENNES